VGVGSGVRGSWPPWIFIHDTDKVEGGLMILFFGLDVSFAPFRNFSADALECLIGYTPAKLAECRLCNRKAAEHLPSSPLVEVTQSDERHVNKIVH